MKVIAGGAQRAPVIALAVMSISLASLVLGVAAGGVPLFAVSIGALIVGGIIAAHRTLFQWHVMLIGLIVVVFFIPISRYTLGSGLPFQLEPYRIVVLVIVALWGASLLVDPRVRFRRSGLEGPLILYAFAVVGSVAANLSTIANLGLDPRVAKQVSYTFTFLLVFFFIVSTVRRFEQIELLVKVLVLCGVALSILAVVENRTGYNVFDHLQSVMPFLQRTTSLDFGYAVMSRGGRFRATGSAQHAIALGALFSLLVPLGIYLAKTSGRKLWILATAILVMGLLATVSRTGIVMILAEVIVFAVLRPRETKRLWPLIIPLLAAVHFAVPGTLGSLKDSFFPKGGIIAEQRGYKDSGRIGDWAPSLRQAAGQPLFGMGLGARLSRYDPNFPRVMPNGRVLDDQWLATLLETGAVGVVAWLWFFSRIIRRLGGAAKADLRERGWLAAALCASITGFAFGMLFFDAFSFTQVTLVLFMVAGFGASLLRSEVVVREHARQLVPTLEPSRV